MDSIWAIGIIPLLCLLFILFVFYLCRKKWIYALIIFLVLIFLNNWTESVPLHKHSSSVTGDIKIITWNIHSSGRTFDSADSVMNVVRLIIKSCADIVCLQEYTPRRCVVLDSLLKNQYPYMACMDNFEEPRNVNAIFSKYPIAFSNAIEMHSSDKDSLTKKINDISPIRRVSRKMLLQSCIILTNKRQIGLVNCHFSSNKYDDVNTKEEGMMDKILMGNMIRKLNASYARNFVESCQSKGIPAMLCGDLNDFSGSKSLCILENDGLLRNCWWEKGCGFGFTYHGHGWMHFRLDYILHTDGIKCTSIRKVNQEFSDHDALFATFKFE